MSDIKQAAKWMQERKNVKRSTWEDGFFWQRVGSRVNEVEDGKSGPLTLFMADLLADDWEVVE